MLRDGIDGNHGFPTVTTRSFFFYRKIRRKRNPGWSQAYQVMPEKVYFAVLFRKFTNYTEYILSRWWDTQPLLQRSMPDKTGSRFATHPPLICMEAS